MINIHRQKPGSPSLPSSVSCPHFFDLLERLVQLTDGISHIGHHIMGIVCFLLVEFPIEPGHPSKIGFSKFRQGLTDDDV